MISTKLPPQDWMLQQIAKSVQAEIEVATEEVVKLAVQEFEKRVREITARTVLGLQNFYSVERLGQQLVIHVQIEEPKNVGV